jgi:hypothetical protein
MGRLAERGAVIVAWDVPAEEVDRGEVIGAKPRDYRANRWDRPKAGQTEFDASRGTGRAFRIP